jgi:hypothetical protein
MKIITGLSEQPKQQSTLVLADGTRAVWSISYVAQQTGWFYDLSWNGTVIATGQRMVSSPNILRQYINKISFGIAVISPNQLEPTTQTALVDGTVTCYLLEGTDLQTIETTLFNAPAGQVQPVATTSAGAPVVVLPANWGPAGGDLAYAYPNPQVVAMHDNTGQRLAFGTVADGRFLKRDGANIIGATVAPGTGDVSGPASSTIGNVAVWADAAGTELSDGGTLGTAAFLPSSNFLGATAAATGDLAGNFPSPRVAAIHTTTGGGTKLTIGAVADGQYLVRSGSTLIGSTPSGAGDVFGPSSTVTVGTVALFAATDGKLLGPSGITLGSIASQPASSVNITGGNISLVSITGSTAALTGLTVNTTTPSSYGSIEVSGTAGAFIDLKAPDTDDFDLRLITGGGGGQIVASGDTGIEIITNNVQRALINTSGLAVTGAISATSTLSASNFSGSSSGTNTGDQTLSSLGATTLGANLVTIANPSAITFPRFNADNTVSSLSASALRTAIGATTIGANVFTLPDPGAITFPRFNADNTVSSLSATDFRTAIGAGTSSTTGTVTSVGGTGSVNGITLTGTVTSSGSLSLGGTLSGVNLASQVTGNLPVANLNGGNNATGSTFWCGNNTWATPPGGGNVTGTAPTIAGRLASFNNTLGTGIQDSGVLASDVVVQGGNATLSIAAITQLKLAAELGYPTGGSITFDLSVSRNRIALTTSLTISATANRANNVSSVLELYNSTGGYLTITWSQLASWKTNGVLPTAIAPGQTLQFLFQCWGTTESAVSINYINQIDFKQFNVRNYGATGDSSTNDRAAIAAADSAANAARGVLVFPAGTYYVGSSLTLSSSAQFEGGALSIASGQTVTFNQAVVAPVQRLFYGSGVVRMEFRGAKCPVEWWGAGTGTESTQVDDRAFIQAAFEACRNYGGDIFAEVIFSRQYWLSDEIVVLSNIGIDTNSASALMSKTTSGTGKGLRIQGPFDTNRTWNLPNFSGFTVFALKVDQASTARINIGQISGSGLLGDGIAVGCNVVGASTLDNIFNVNFIAGCKSAIRIYSNVDAVVAPLATIEGNEFNVNFVNDNLNGVVFDSLDDYTLPTGVAYTKGSAWDCNIFNITALDAHAGVRRGFWYRATGLQYSQNVFRVPVWFGGFDSSGIWIDTSAATKSTFEIGVRTGEQMISYGQLNLRGSGNTLVINGSGNTFGDQLAPTTFTAVTSSGRAGFNGGSPVPRNRMKVDFVLSGARAFGDTQTFYIYSPLVDGYSNRLRVSFIDSGGFIVNNLYDNSNNVANEIVVVFQNASGVTRPIDFVISAWVEIAY